VSYGPGNTVWVTFIFLLSSGAPVYVCATLLLGKMGMSIAVLLVAESVHLAHSHQHHLHQRRWMSLNCWTHDSWLFGSMVEVVTSLAHFQNLPEWS